MMSPSKSPPLLSDKYDQLFEPQMYDFYVHANLQIFSRLLGDCRLILLISNES